MRALIGDHREPPDERGGFERPIVMTSSLTHSSVPLRSEC